MDKNNYFESRNIKIEKNIHKILVDLPEFVEQFFIGIETQTSPLTRQGYALDLRIFFDFLYHNTKKFANLDKDSFELRHLEQVDTYDIEKFISYLSYYVFQGKEYTNSIETKSRKLACIKSFFKYYYNRNLLEKDVASKVGTPKLHEKPIIRLESEEVEDILHTVECGNLNTERQKSYNVKTKLRDLAILTLFLGTGIRISELVGLNIKDIDFNNNAFIVTRKGGNQEILYFNDEVAISLLEYLEERFSDESINKDEPALFLSLQNKRISIRAVEYLVKKYARIVTPLKKITPHKLRSTFGTNLYRETKDIYVVAELLGHKDINVTRKHYADIGEDIKKQASNKVSLREDLTPKND